MESISIIFHYKQSGISTNNEKQLEQLKSELKENYVTNFRPNSGPQSGGLLDSMIEIVFNIDLIDFVKILRDGVIFDAITRGKESFLLKPLFDAFSKAENETDYWDYYKISFIFDDTIINIFGMDRMFTSKLNEIIATVFKNYNNINNSELGKPYEINIPIQKVLQENQTYKFINQEALTDYEKSEYLKYWAISYHFGFTKKVYDVEQSLLLDEEWHYDF
jgi:hypothetical protein